MPPCQLRIWSIVICNKPFSLTAANSIPRSQVYKLCLKCVVCMHQGELLTFFVFCIQIFPYVFLAHKPATAMILGHD